MKEAHDETCVGPLCGKIATWMTLDLTSEKAIAARAAAA